LRSFPGPFSFPSQPTRAIPLAGQVASAAKWSAVSTLSRLIIGYGTLLLVAPFISAKEFGLFSLILVILSFGQILSEAGLRDALVYRSELARLEFSSIFWLCLLAALFVFILFWVAAPLLAAIFRFSDLERWIRISAPVATILAIGAPYQALLEKDLRFRTLALVEVTSSVAGLALTIAWMLMGSALAALVGGMMLRAVTRTALLLAVGIPQLAPEFRFSAASLNVVGRFGAFRITDLTLGFFVQRLDRILIAIFLGQEALGVYAFAWLLAVEPMQRLIPTFTQVLFPGFSKIKADLPRVARVYCKGLKAISAINLPIIVAVVVCAPVAVPLLFGDHWIAAIPVIQILAVVAAMRVAMGPSGVLLMSQGRPDVTLYWNVGVSMLGAVALVAAATIGGLREVAIAFAGLYVLLFLVHPFLLLRPVLPDLSVGQLLHALAAPILLSCAAGVAAAIAGGLEPWGGWAELTIQCLVGGVTYAAGFLMVDRGFVRETAGLLAAGPKAPD
jgi:O-antigen/teichoic acid export membrane protein